MRKAFGVIVFLIASAGVVLAQTAAGAPEIDPGSAGTALALLTGSLLVIRGLRKK